MDEKSMRRRESRKTDLNLRSFMKRVFEKKGGGFASY
jgi:hypothetical protein